MDDGQALLRAILREPAEDTPRLVYADWLDENGQHDRAEFIRVQVALSKPTLGPDGTGDSDERYRLTRRESQLLADGDWRNAAVWFCWDGTLLQNIWGGPTGDRHPTLAIRTGDMDGTDRECLHCSLRRGFIAHVTATHADFREQAGALFESQPVERIVLPGVVRDGIVFRTSNGHHNDLPREWWAELGLPRCELPGDCRQRGTHAHMTEDELSRYLVAYGRKSAGIT
jgi:uncharacterized protein (TIGR02996 family)